MIYYRYNENLLDSNCDVLVNCVNCVGVAGKGVALEFKKRYPEMYRDYKHDCKAGFIETGKTWWWITDDNRYIVCFPTKQHWRDPSKLEWIESGLIDFAYFLNIDAPWNPDRYNSIAIPKLGCGNGGLSWNDVHPLMIKYLKDLPVEVRIYV